MINTTSGTTTWPLGDLVAWRCAEGARVPSQGSPAGRQLSSHLEFTVCHCTFRHALAMLVLAGAMVGRAVKGRCKISCICHINASVLVRKRNQSSQCKFSPLPFQTFSEHLPRGTTDRLGIRPHYSRNQHTTRSPHTLRTCQSCPSSCVLLPAVHLEGVPDASRVRSVFSTTMVMAMECVVG